MKSKNVLLGIDIGGTNTKFGLVSKKGKILHNWSYPTCSDLPIENLFSKIFTNVNLILTENTYNLVGVGIGAPNANHYTGFIENPPNLGWGTINVNKVIKNYYDGPVSITNDANAAALGELLFGAGKGKKHFILLTLGTGLGSGIVVDGKIVYGHDGFAGELGHIIVKEDGRLCGCGRKGCLETYVSATGLVKNYLEILNNENEFNISAKDIYNKAIEGDKVAIKSFEKTGEILGKAIANFVAYLSPETVFLFGGLANSGKLLFDPLNKVLDENILNIYKNKISVELSGLAEGEASILGSAALILNEIKNSKKLKNLK